MQASRTKAVHDTMNIKDELLRSRTVKNVNMIGKHLVSELKIPKRD